MDYPSDFSTQAQARMLAAQIRAAKDFKASVDMGLNLDTGFRQYIVRMFAAFASEACELGRQFYWTPERIASEVQSFIRRLVIEGHQDMGCGILGVNIGHYVSNMDGTLLPETWKSFKQSREWVQFQADLLAVAELHAKTPDFARPMIQSAAIVREKYGVLPREHSQAEQVASEPQKRLKSTITSHVAVRRMEEYIEKNHLDLSEFAGKADTTDRTLRTFRRKATVRRDILSGIAKAMGISLQDLLKE